MLCYVSRGWWIWLASAYYMQRLFGLQLDISGLWWNKWFLSGVSLLEGSLSLILLVRLLYFLYCANGPNHGVYGVMAGYISYVAQFSSGLHNLSLLHPGYVLRPKGYKCVFGKVKHRISPGIRTWSCIKDELAFSKRHPQCSLKTAGLGPSLASAPKKTFSWLHGAMSSWFSIS